MKKTIILPYDRKSTARVVSTTLTKSSRRRRRRWRTTRLNSLLENFLEGSPVVFFLQVSVPFRKFLMHQRGFPIWTANFCLEKGFMRNVELSLTKVWEFVRLRPNCQAINIMLLNGLFDKGVNAVSVRGPRRWDPFEIHNIAPPRFGRSRHP